MKQKIVDKIFGKQYSVMDILLLAFSVYIILKCKANIHLTISIYIIWIVVAGIITMFYHLITGKDWK